MLQKLIKATASALCLGLTLVASTTSFAAFPLSIPRLDTSAAPGAKGLPCPLGTTLSMVKMNVFSCIGVAVADPCNAVIDGYAPPCGAAGLGSAAGAMGAAGGAAAGAAGGGSGSGAPQQSQVPNAVGAKAVMRLLSCDEYSAMSPMVNPQNPQPEPETQWAYGDGLVQNGWWAKKMTYPDSASNSMREGYGGAVIRYVETDLGGGRMERSETQVLAAGECQRKIDVPASAQSSCVNENGSFRSASCATGYSSSGDR